MQQKLRSTKAWLGFHCGYAVAFLVGSGIGKAKAAWGMALTAACPISGAIPDAAVLHCPVGLMPRKWQIAFEQRVRKHRLHAYTGITDSSSSCSRIC